VAIEIAYDRALVCLADRVGVDVSPCGFAHPKIERARLEFELMAAGVDLEEPPPPESSARTESQRALG